MSFALFSVVWGFTLQPKIGVVLGVNLELKYPIVWPFIVINEMVCNEKRIIKNLQML